MSLIPLFRHAFEVGCGLDFDQINRSEELRVGVANQSRIISSLSDSPEKRSAYKLGHINYGSYLHSQFPKNSSDSDFVEVTAADQLNRALLHLLGKKLLDKARTRLPIEFDNYIAEFKSGELDQQQLALVRVYLALQDYNYFNDESNSLEEAAAETDWFTELFDKSPWRDRYLPAVYDSWGKGKIKPNCLGLCLMLAAFAQATEAPYVVCNITNYWRDRIWEVYGEVSLILLADIRQQGLTANQELINHLSYLMTRSRNRQFTPIDFHPAIAIQLNNGWWVLVDPYLNGFGRLPRVWKTASIYQTLIDCQEVLPGLSIFRQDLDPIQNAKRAFVQNTRSALVASKEFVAEIPGDLSSGEDFLSYLSLSKKVKIMRNLMVPKRNRRSWSVRKFIAYYLFALDKTAPYRQVKRQIQALADKVVSDDQYRQNILDRLATLFHTSVVESVNEAHRWCAKYGTLQPVLEFALAEYNLAWMVLNNIRCDHPGFNIAGTELLGLASSPILWHEACDLSSEERGIDPNEKLKTAEAAVRRLPTTFWHPLVAKKLAYLDRLRQEKGGENATESVA